MVLILMGPTGCGKTTIGRLLAQRLGWPFLDGDDFHPAANVAKMHSGTPLDDNDRRPWLLALRKEIEDRSRAGQSAIVACSALKRIYRELLGVDQQSVKTVYLRGSFEVLQERLSDRRGHFMPPELLRSQLETLELPEGGLVVDIDDDPAMIVTRIIASLKQAALSGKAKRDKNV
ncbi:MAG: gluconokinase [Deltaproteobacteria bacterium]|jgi:carbohydrate kinase (thermoresistant glucokinase family)|nr:gluconokinase [Deltaproteobacteria bacterium]